MPRTPGTLGHLADHERWDQFISDVEAGLIGVGPKGDKGDKGDPGDLSAAGMAAAANAVSAASTATAAQNAAILAQDAAEDAKDIAVTAATEALASQTAAQNAANAADLDATAANNAALLAERWATLMGQPVTGSEYSAKHHATEAAAWGSTRGAKIAYQPTEPTDPVLGEIWIDSNADTFDLNQNDLLPPQSGQSGKYLSTNGTAPIWTAVDLLPGVSGEAGKYLTNNGSVVSWGTPTPPGLVLVATQSFTAQASVPVNGCFTSAYSNYRIIISGYTGSANGWVRFRLRVGGVDATSGYQDNRFAAGAVTSVNVNPGGGNYISIGFTDNTSPLQADLLVCGPQLAVRTTLSSHSLEPNVTNGMYQNWFAGVIANTVQYDGFTIYPDSGTITGTVRVYGLRN